MSNSDNMIQPPSDEMQPLFQDVAAIIQQARQHVREAVNHAMVQNYCTDLCSAFSTKL